MDFNLPSFVVPRIEIPHITPPEITVAENDYADVYHDRLLAAIGDFERNLDNDHEVAIRLVSFGQTVTFHVVGIGYRNPKLIVFHGVTDDGRPIELVQHVSQISFLLMAERKLNPSDAPHRIGFKTESATEPSA